MKHFSTVLLCAILLTAASIRLIAQEGSSFGAFVAVPVGDFKSTDLNNGGFAKNGWGVVFDSRSSFRFLPENMFLYFHSTYQWNDMDDKKISEAFTEALGMRTVVGKSRYSPLLTTVGPSYIIHAGSKMKLMLNGTIGLMFNNTRSFGIRVYDSNGSEVVREAVGFDNNVAFAYTVGAELNFPIMKDVIGGSVYFDYTAAKQSTTLTFEAVDPVKSFQELQYLNCGFRFTVSGKEAR